MLDCKISSRYYNGTLFRFPLRNQPSKLSTKLYTAERVRELFDAFKEEAALILLFVKNIEKICLYETDETAREKPIFTVRVNDDCVADVRKRRQEFLQEAENLCKAKRSDCAVMNMVMKISEWDLNLGNADHKWLVCNCINTENERLEELSAKLKLLPWMGVARPLTYFGSQASEELDGRIFCFLPLPPDVHTGLPVHVNGAFGLTDNRRGLKWPGPECRDDAAEWNELLLEYVGSIAYTSLLLSLQQLMPDIPSQNEANHFYMLWPDLNRVQKHWLPMLKALFTSIIHQQIFYTEANGGTWIEPSKVLVDPLHHSSLPVSNEVRNAVVALLKTVNEPVVSFPNHVLKIIDEYMSGYTTDITPMTMRTLLKNYHWIESTITRDDKLLLLEYVLSDKSYASLSGVPLLPLANGTFVEFCPLNRCNSSQLVYVASDKHPQSVLPNMQSRFLDESIPSTVLRHLCSLAVLSLNTASHTQLLMLTSNRILSLLREALPNEWFSPTDQVRWYPGTSTHPPESWPESMWLWMKSQHPTPSLSDFEDLPLIRHVSGKATMLVKLRRNSKVIRKSHYGSSLPENVASLLTNMGGIVLTQVPWFLENYPHLQDYVSPPNADGVLRVLQALGDSAVISEIKICPVQLKKVLRSFLLSQTVEPSRKHFLSTLPIYESMKSQSLIAAQKDGKLASVSPLYLPLPSGISVKNAHKILSGSDNDTQRLLKQLNAPIISRTAFLRNEVLRYIDDSYYCNDDVLKLMKWVLMNFSNFCQEDHSFPDSLKHLKFVDVESNNLRAPCELYDPRERLLKQLFDGEIERFPQGFFLDEEFLIILKKLGMKSLSSVTATDIVQTADNLSNFREEVRIKKTDAILKLLEFNSTLLDTLVRRNTTLASYLVNQHWLTRRKSPPGSYPSRMQWFSGRQELYRPAEIVPLPHSNLVGASMPVLPMALQSYNSQLSRRFGWMNLPIDNVLQQLTAVRRCVPTDKSNIALVKKVVKEIYDFLSSKISVIREKQAIQTRLSTEPFVFVDNCFVDGKRVSFEWKSRGAPYLYSVPEWARKYGSLLQLFGVKNQFRTKDFIQALLKMQVGQMPAPLNQDEFKVAKTFICALTDASESELRAYDGHIPVLDEKRMLRAAQELVINSTPWVKADENMKFVNPEIPVNIAYKLGAKALLDRKLERRSNPNWRPYGQVEDLTDRLKGILKAYPCDVGIFKELVQNADDAKATEIHFVYDTRHLPTKYIFQSEGNWKELQGPALCVYNNRPFEQKDIEGLRSLGIGSKVDDPEKIGQYGIGFNAVYHLTDCPSFLSDGDTLGILDPQVRYAPGATQQAPGALYEHIDEDFYNDCKDVMEGFRLSDELPLKGATMFRLPLRNRLMAKNSAISKEVSVEAIERLLNVFQAEARNILLFLNHINRITISYLRNNKLDVKYTVYTQLSSESQQKREELVNYVKTSKCVHTEDIGCFEVTYPIVINDSNRWKEEWLIHQRIGCDQFGEVSDIPDGKDGGLLPRAGVAAKVSELNKCLTYQAFCFLPLPVETHLPVHVNGHFILDSARRNLWQDKGNEGFRSVWNRFIKAKVLAPAYVSLLVAARNYIPMQEQPVPPRLDWYLNLFPSVNQAKSDWKELAICVYQLIASQNTPLLPHITWNLASNIARGTHPCTYRYRCTWFCVSNGYFKDPAWFGTSLSKVISSIGFPLVDASLHSNFEAAKVPVNQTSSDEIIHFLKGRSSQILLRTLSHIFCPVTESLVASIDNVKLLLNYCLRSPTCCMQIEGLPLLVTEDKMLRSFSSSNPVYLTTFSELVPSRKDLFVHSELFEILSKDKIPDVLTEANVFKPFDISNLSVLLPHVLPIQWRNTAYVRWNHEQVDVPNRLWMGRLWTFLTTMDIDRNVPDKSLDALKEWPIFPTAGGILTSTSISKFVFDLSFNNAWSPNQCNVAAVLRKLKCLQITMELFDDCIKDKVAKIIHNYVAHPNSPSDVLSVLGQMMSKESIAGKLKEGEMLKLLQFFQEDEDTLNQHNLDIPTLRRLPFYKTFDGRFVSLEDYKTFYVLPESVPLDDLVPWMVKKKCMVLEQCHQLHLLYTYIGVTKKTAVEFYTSFIFPIFQQLQQPTRLSLLLFLRDDLIPRVSWNEKAILVDRLLSLPIIADEDGVLRPASNFYNRHNTVYQVFVPDKQLLPAEFCSDDWIQFLQGIGLHTEVTTVEFEKYADRVATAASSSESTTIYASMCLVNHLMSDESPKFRERNFLKRISEIKFVPPERPDESLLKFQLQPQRADPRPPPLIQFRGSISSDAQRLVWTCCDLLPSWAMPSGKNETFILDCLGVYTDPPLDKVLDHLMNLTTTLSSSTEKELPNSQGKLLEEITMEIYGFLMQACKCSSKRWRGGCTDCCREIEQRLRNCACILIEHGHVFVQAKQLVFDLHDEIAPYLYKVPREYGAYDHLLKKLGASEVPQPRQYAFVLHKIRNLCEDNKMEPNSEEKAKSAVFGLFLSLWNLLENGQSKHTEMNPIDGDQLLNHVRESLSTVETLYLPNVDSCLKRSTELVHFDCSNYINRIDTSIFSILLTPNQCGLKLELDERLLNLLPERLAVPPLRSLVLEEIHPDSQNDVCIAEQDTNGCRVTELYRNLLRSPKFKEGLERIFQHENHQRKVPHRFQTKVKQFQTNLQIVCLRSLQTHLVNTKDGAEVHNSTEQGDLFVNQDHNTKEMRLYISHGAKKEDLNRQLCRGVEFLIGHYFKQETLLMAVLSRQYPEEIENILDKAGVTSVTTDEQTVKLGTEIPVCFQILLQQDATFFFREDEKVGYLKEEKRKHKDENVNQESENDVSFCDDGNDDIDSDDDAADDQDENGKEDENEDEDKYDDDDLYSFDENDEKEEEIESEDRTSDADIDVDEEYEYNEEERGDAYDENKNDLKDVDGDKVSRPVYVYAKVIKRVEDPNCDTNRYLARYCVDIGEREFLEVGVLDLYKFVPPSSPGNVQQTVSEGASLNRNESETTETIIHGIKQELKEIWNLPDVERKKAIRRLYFRWHQDRNPSNISQATVVTQFIEGEIRRLSTTSREVPDFDSWSQVARQQQQSFENYRQHCLSQHSSRNTFGTGTFNDYFRPVYSSSYFDPDAKEARRWIKQAREDLRAAELCLSAERPLFYMTCFQSQQVVEKALKAALYSTCGLADEQLKSHDVIALASEVERLRGCPSDVYHFAVMVRNYYIPTRYPNQHPRPVVPADVYKLDDANTALQAAQTVLEMLQRFIGIPV